MLLFLTFPGANKKKEVFSKDYLGGAQKKLHFIGHRVEASVFLIPTVNLPPPPSSM